MSIAYSFRMSIALPAHIVLSVIFFCVYASQERDHVMAMFNGVYAQLALIVATLLHIMSTLNGIWLSHSWLAHVVSSSPIMANE